MIELFEGFFADPWDVKAIKAITKNKCAIWLTGQNAENGFVIDVAAKDAVQQIMDARDGIVDEDGDEIENADADQEEE